MKANIEKVVRDVYDKRGHNADALNIIRQKAYTLCILDGKSEEEVISETFNFAKYAIKDGKVTKEDVEKEIAKILSMNLKNKKTR